MGSTEATFYRGKKPYVGLESDPVRPLQSLQRENGQLKKRVVELSWDKVRRPDVRAKQF